MSQHRRVLAQVRQAGVRHVVKLSAIGASPESPIALMREHHEIDEESPQRPSQLDVAQAAPYMQNLLRAANAVRREGRLAAPMAGLLHVSKEFVEEFFAPCGELHLAGQGPVVRVRG